MSKRLSIFLCIVIIALVASCKANDGEINKITPQPLTTDSNYYTVVPSTFGSMPNAQVISYNAYRFANESTNQIYFAVEYRNSGDCPMIVNIVNIKFKIDGFEYTKDFEPALYEHFITYPNEIGYIAIWTDDIYFSDAENNFQIEVFDVKLNGVLSHENRKLLEVENIKIVQNYADFATVTGLVSPSKENHTANVIFCAFYDDSNNLIGVWYFSLFDDTESFATQLISLPIPDLATNTHSIKAVGFGID